MAADLVADAADGADQRAIRAGINFSPQVVDIHLNDIRERISLHAPNFLDDRGAGDGLARVAEQEVEQGVLPGTELDGTPGTAHLMRNAIDDQIVKVSEVVLRPAAAEEPHGLGPRVPRRRKALPRNRPRQHSKHGRALRRTLRQQE